MTVESDAMGRQSVRGLVWVAGGYGAQAVAQFAVLALLARLLTAAEFGLVSAALVVVGLARVITDSVIGPAITQRDELTEVHIRTAFSLAIYVGLLATVLFWLLAGSVASLFNMPDLVPVVQVLSAMFMIQAFGAVPLALLQRDLEFPRFAAIEAISFMVGYALVGSVLALLGFGVWALVGAQLGYSSLRSLALMVARPHPKSLYVDRGAAADILVFGSGVTLGRFFNFAALQADYLMVGRELSAASLGIYGRAYQLAVRPAMLLGQALDKVMFPTMSRLQNDRDRLARAYLRTVSIAASISAPLAALGVVLGPETVRLVLGPGWDEAVAPFQILAAGLLFRMGYKVSDTLARATGRVYARAWRQAVYAALVLVGAGVGTRWGLDAVAALVAIAIVINHLVMAELSVVALGIRRSRFAAAHRRGLALGALTAAVILPSTLLLRSMDAPYLLVLATGLGVGALTFGTVMRFSGPAVLGPDLVWLADRLRGQKGRVA